jgi:hypothetical protein
MSGTEPSICDLTIMPRAMYAQSDQLCRVLPIAISVSVVTIISTGTDLEGIAFFSDATRLQRSRCRPLSPDSLGVAPSSGADDEAQVNWTASWVPYWLGHAHHCP